MDEFGRTNLAHWDERVAPHTSSVDYAVDRIATDPDRVSGVVAADRALMGDVAGQRLLHLQCHIGTDTVSWGKLGATVTGLDFSEPAIDTARDLARRAGLGDARFVVADVDDAVAVLDGERFDVVYTGIGALCWLPDMTRWAHTVGTLLAPGGRLFLREAHPVLWALDYDRDDDLLVLAYPYFRTERPQRWDEEGTYVEVGGDVSFANTATYTWNHGLGEILSAVLDAGLRIEAFVEHRDVPWRPYELFEPANDRGDWRLPERLRDLAPLAYTLVASNVR